LLILTLVTTSAFAQKAGYRNDTIGESYDTYRANNHTTTNAGDAMVSKDSLVLCDSPIRAALFGAQKENAHYCQRTDELTGYQFVDNTLKSIDGTFDRGRYSAMLEVITAKYGKPNSTVPYKYTATGTGAQFKGDVVTWHRQGSTITLSEWKDGEPASANESGFLIIDDAYAAQQKPHVTF
jgi:hypothetical protein